MDEKQGSKEKRRSYWGRGSDNCLDELRGGKK